MGKTWALTVALACAAQTLPPGPQVLTFLSDVDGTDQPYALYLPKNLDAARKYPLVISLHGEESNHRLNLRRVLGRGNRPGETDAEASRRFPPLPDVDFIVAAPLARGSMGYQGIAEKDVYDVLADVERRFPVDEDRVYLTGVDLGGGGALRLGLTRPDVWAAIAVVCPEAPPGTEELAPNALGLPVHLFHGEQDPVVSVEVSRKWQRALLNAEANVEYVEYPAARHNAWDSAYRNAAIFKWFAQHRRNRFPDRIRFLTRQYKYASAYWARIDGLTPGALASIDARFTASGRLEVHTAGLDGFTLNLAGHPKAPPGAALRLTIDGSALAVKAPREAVSFQRDGETWKPGRYQPPAGAKRPGLEGPIADAIAGRHVYVYGTGEGDAAEVKRRWDGALAAANWSTPHVPLLLSLRTVPDMEVTNAEIAVSNLVLFGTRQTNTLIARYAARFPMELNPGAADYGLIFVTPIDGRYAVVCSGLGWPSGTPLYSSPATLEDYVLFKGTLDNVVARGRFDRNWKLPPDGAAPMKATGAVIIP